MEIRELTAAEFETLLRSEPDGSIYQTEAYGKLIKDDNDQLLFLGCFDEMKISIGGMMLILKKKFNLMGNVFEAYCPHGFLFNYYDFSMLKEFIEQLKHILHDKRITTLHIETPISYSALVDKALLSGGFIKEKDLTSYQIELDDYPTYEKDEMIYVEESDDILELVKQCKRNNLIKFVTAMKPYLKAYITKDVEDNLLGCVVLSDFARSCEIIFSYGTDEHIESELMDYVCRLFKEKRYHTIDSSAKIVYGKQIPMLGGYSLKV